MNLAKKNAEPFPHDRVRFNCPLKKSGATADLSSSAAVYAQNTAGQASSGTQNQAIGMSKLSLSLSVGLIAAVVFASQNSLCAVEKNNALGFRVPEGFEVTLFAGDELAHDIYSMTIDSRGRVVVAGRGYVKILHDTNHDGVADKATLFSSAPGSGAHGMCFDGNDLICTGDNSILRFRDRDGNGVADGRPEVIARLRNPEHGANGITRGPDGWFYLSCGNDAGVTAEHATGSHSPIKKPRRGAVVRFSPDGKKIEVFADGFRNPYDLAFNSRGHLFIVDADGERDEHLPWYSPTRLFDVAVGQHHGWVLAGWQRAWSRPGYFPDNVPRLAELGRGSPTGAVVYRHNRFPKKYRDGVFSVCWTLGRVYFCPLKPHQDSYQSDVEVFMQTTGSVGFAPVDVAVGPKGDMFVAIGGRRTRGSVFRIRYTGSHQKSERYKKDQPVDELTKLLTMPQPDAAWSRKVWAAEAKQLGQKRLLSAAIEKTRNAAQRGRAIEIITDLFGGLTANQANLFHAEINDYLVARVAWSLAHNESTIDVLLDWAKSDKPQIARAAFESLTQRGGILAGPRTREVLQNGLASHFTRVRSAAIVAARRGMDNNKSGPANLAKLFLENQRPQNANVRRRLQLACLWLIGPQTEHDRYTAICLEALDQSTDPRVRLEAVRLLQILVGDVRLTKIQPDVHAGYAANDAASVSLKLREKIADHLITVYSTRARSLDLMNKFEMARLLGMLEVRRSDGVETISSLLQPNTNPADDIHFLIVLSRMAGKRSPDVTKRTADSLATLHRRMDRLELYASRNWPLRVSEVYVELAKRDPMLAKMLIASKSFGHPGHSLFASRMPREQKQQAARKIVRRIDQSDEDSWTSALVSLVAELPSKETLPLLREQWEEDPGLRDSILLALARTPKEEDRPLFIERLNSAQPNVVQASARALLKLPKVKSPAEFGALIKTLRQYCADKRHENVRLALSQVLFRSSGIPAVTEINAKNLTATYQPIFDWFDRTYPKESQKLRQLKIADGEEWTNRISSINWKTGNIDRGKIVFEAQACHRCHRGSGRLGPDLAGIGQRFSKTDLIAAIIDPNKDVSPLYKTTQITTRSGQIHLGLIIYKSPEGTLLQTRPDTTIRVTREELESIRTSRMSLMPTGLLRDISDRQIADLYRYLRSLEKK